MTSQELVPYFLINFGLSRTLQSIADDSVDLPGIHITYSEALNWPLSNIHQDMTIQLYRLFQEVHSNLIRHAKPSEISIHLKTDLQGLRMSILHNGVGLSQTEYERLLASGKSLGLKNIDYRYKLLQADLTFERLQDRSLVEIFIPHQNLTLISAAEQSTIG
jgi:signal transduction histidine kinase